MGAGNVKGLTVELGGETRGLEAALKQLGKASNDINKELGQVERGLKFDPSNTVLLAQKQGLLADKIASTRERLEALQQAQARVDAMYASGEIDDGQYRAFQRDVESTKSKLGTFEGQLRDVESQQKQTGTAAKNMGDDVDKAGDKAKDGGKKFGDTFKSIGVAAGAAALAVGAALLAVGTAVLDSADELQIMSDATGLSAERLQELQYIGKDVGVELETIAGAQAKLTKSMNAARNGTEAQTEANAKLRKEGKPLTAEAGAQADAFKALGISVTDGNGNLRDAKVVMGEAFDALSKMGNETERDALSMLIFGKGAQDLNPLLKLGADGMAAMSEKARESGAVMSNEAVAGLDAFGDTLDQLKMGAMAGFGEWFATVLPDVQGFLDLFAPGGAGIGSLIPPEIQAQLDTLSASIDNFSVNTAPQISAWFDEFIGPTMDEISAAFEAVAMEVIPTITSIVDFVSANWPMIQQAIEPIMTAVKNLVGGAMLIIAGVIRTVMAVIRGDWGAAWEGIKTVFSGVWKVLQSTPIGQWIEGIGDMAKKLGPWFEDMKGKVIGIIKDLLAKLRGPIDTIKSILSNLNPFQRNSPSLVDNVLAGVAVIRDAYSGLGDMQLGGPMLAGVGAGYGAASPSMLTSSSVGDTVHIGSIVIDGSKMPTADFDGLIASIQMAKRMGG